MSQLAEQIRKSMESKTDEDLMDILEGDPQEYSPEALTICRSVLDSRGFNEDERKRHLEESEKLKKLESTKPRILAARYDNREFDEATEIRIRRMLLDHGFVPKRFFEEGGDAELGLKESSEKVFPLGHIPHLHAFLHLTWNGEKAWHHYPADESTNQVCIFLRDIHRVGIGKLKTNVGIDGTGVSQILDRFMSFRSGGRSWVRFGALLSGFAVAMAITGVVFNWEWPESILGLMILGVCLATLTPLLGFLLRKVFMGFVSLSDSRAKRESMDASRRVSEEKFNIVWRLFEEDRALNTLVAAIRNDFPNRGSAEKAVLNYLVSRLKTLADKGEK